MKVLVDWLVYASVRLFFGLVGAIPSRLAYLLCSGIATVVYFLDRKHRRIGMINLSIAFPEKEERWKKRVLRKSFQQLGDQAVELSRMRRLTRERLARRVRYEKDRGVENYLNAKGRGSGVLYVTAHVSAWELLPAAHALYGYPLSFVARPLDNPFLEDWSTRLRGRFRNKVLPKQNSVRPTLRLLREREDVGFLIDQNVQAKDGVFVPFLNATACTTSSVALLALKTSAPVVPGFIYPSGPRGHYTIRFYPAVSLIRTGDSRSDVVANTALFSRYVEEVIREFPHCWLWGHRRFQTQPDGKSPYRPT